MFIGWVMNRTARCSVLRQSGKGETTLLLATLLALAISGAAAFGQSNPKQPGSEGTLSPSVNATKRRLPSYLASRTVPNANAVRMYRLIWGIDNIEVKQVSSGALILFKFRVLDPAKAKVINNEDSKPLMVDEASHAALQIPVLEQIGKLRQTNAPEAGREYSMLFSNKGGYVKPGNRVSVIIGTFHLEGLIVQ